MEAQSPSPEFIKKFGEHVQRFTEEMRYVDELTLVALKGHLLIEEALWHILTKHVFHAEKLDDARLRFPQLVAFARAISLDEQNNPMWDLMLAINALRNELAHTLQDGKKAEKLRRVKELYTTICKDDGLEAFFDAPDHIVMANVCALCCGFLWEMEKEVERFRSAVDELDRVMNPHRHKQA